MIKIINLSNNNIISSECKVADTFFSRFIGLMGKKDLSPGSGLLIKPCNSIHMFFMRFPIDVLFVDKNNIVLYIYKNLQPWRITNIISQAHYVIELPKGTIELTDTRVGHSLKLD